MKLVTKKKNSIKELYDLKMIWGRKDLADSFHWKLIVWTHSVKHDAELIDPIFLGLIHTERWQRRLKENL